MEVNYNPQLGCRRTIFGHEYDFLIGIHSCELTEDGLWLTADTYRGRQAVVKVRFLTETVFRFQMCPPDGETSPRNPVFGEAKEMEALGRGEASCYAKLPEGFGVQLTDAEKWYAYGTQRVQVRFRKDFWEMSVYAEGKLLTKEQVFDTNVDNRWKTLPVGYRLGENGRCAAVHETMYLYSDEAFWGFGEKFTDLNKRGQLLHCWQKDALSTNTEDSYKGHPFFISSRGYAVLLNTFTRCSFDMGHTSQVSYQMSSEDGCLDYILFAEPTGDYRALLGQYISLTGEIPMIPKWAFGFWMSKCTYQSRQEIEEVVNCAIKQDIPIDVIHIDSWQKPEKSGCWEWDTKRFPDPEGMIRWLGERGVHLSIWNYPYVTEDSPAFEELARRGYFVKNKEGKPALFYAMADAEHKAACFDFTNPELLAWYEEKVTAVLQMGVSVVKTDFSEAVPEDAVYYDGTTGIEGHNRITYLYAQTVYNIMKKCGQRTGNLPMLWGRSGYAGSHRIPAAWAGDSSSSLNNHSAVLKGGLSLAMSGVAFWGYDLGGFYNTAPNGDECLPSEEEYLRSVELGLFMPLARAHGKTPREPWSYSPEVLNTVRRFDKIRHRLVPYLYSTACESHLEAVPMLRPLLLEYPKDPVARMQELSCMLGGSILLVPPFDRSEYEAYLPEGKWLNLTSGEIVEGGQYISLAPSMDELPVFQRENTILPILGKKADGVHSDRKEPAGCAGYTLDSIGEDSAGQVPEGAFHNLEVNVFFCSDMEAAFYDEQEHGQIRKYYFRAFADEKNSCLKIETDMDVCRVNLRTAHSFEAVYLNGEQL